MNLLLLYDSDLGSGGGSGWVADAAGEHTVRLTDQRARHARDVLRVRAGDTLRVGRLGGDVGTAVVVSDDEAELTLRVHLDGPPPPRPGIDLLLAMPRPKALKRLLPAVASMGVDRVVLLNAARVEKSYFDAQALEAETVSRLFDLGLEQGRDTVRPTLLLERRFRPFVEDRLAKFAAGAACLVAHPGPATEPDRNGAGGRGHERLVLAIGPEGGWVPFELDLLRAAGFGTVSLGVRPLRTEVAIPALIGATGRLHRG